MVAGGTTEVMVVLTGDTELIGDDEFTVIFSYEPPDGGVSAEAAMLNAAVTSATVSLVAMEIAQDGTLTASVSGVDGATIESATLPVEIVKEIIPRSYSLTFDVAAVSVVAGGMTEVMVVLTGDTELIGDDEFTVIFSYEPPDGGVSAEAAMLNAAVTSATVSLVATAIAQDGTLTASVSGVDGATFAPATLSVEIIPRSYSLAFNVETVSVVAGDAAQVMVVLTGDTELIGADEFTVMFSYEPPDGGVSVDEAVILNADITRATVSLIATAIAQDGTMTATVSGVDGATFAPAKLAVDIVREIIPRSYSLVFDVAAVSVVAGGTTEVMVVLTGDTELIGADEFTVIFSYEPPDGGVSVDEAVILNADITRVTVSLMATAIAQDGTLTATVSGVDGATFAPATLPVEIVKEIIPRSYSLAFNVETVSVVAGDAAQVLVVLTGDTELIGADEFTVMFSYEPPDGGVSAEAAMLNAAVTSATVSLMATAIAQDGTLTASVSGVDGATFAPATLSVEIVKEIIPRSYSLAFDVAAVSVVAGDAAQVLVVLTGDTELIGADEFTVMFSYEPPDGGVSADEAVILNAAVTSATVSLMATAIAQDGTLTASVSGVDGATFAPATLPVEIVREIIPRSYSLAFDVAAVSVVAGATAQVMVVLTGDTELIGADEFTVMFSYEPPDGGVSADEAVILNAAVTSATVSLMATAIAQDGTLTASVSGVDGATIESATLPVEIVKEIIPRSYSLGFDVAAVSVVAGGTTEVMVVLTGDTELIGDDEFTVMFSYEPQDGGVSAEDAMLNAAVTSATVSLMATAIAQDGTLTASVSGVDGATFAPATLTVTVIRQPDMPPPVVPLRVFTLSFLTLDNEPLADTTARVLAGGMTKVAVRLEKDVLRNGETLQVTLRPTTVTVIPSTLTLTPGEASTTFTIKARHDVDPPEGTVVALGEVMLGGARVLDTRVVSTALAVEIVKRRFQLSFRPSGRQFSQTERPNTVIADNSSTQSVHSTITVAEDIEIRSLRVRVEILGPVGPQLRIVLVSPEGVEVLLHNLRSAGSAPAEYTSLNRTGLNALSGAPALGEWVLTAGDYVPMDTSTLRAWSLEINGFARVLAGGNVSLVASLTEIETPLGLPRLFPGETLTMELRHSGANVGFTPSTLVFGASATTAAFRLEAAFNATPRGGY